MGYDLFITRRAYATNWAGPDIEMAEWRSFVADDPKFIEMEEDGPDGFGFVDRSDGQPEMVWYLAGTIVATNPSLPLVQQMVKAAVALGAKVQGDDGEVYNAAGEVCHLGFGPAVSDIVVAQELAQLPSVTLSIGLGPSFAMGAIVTEGPMSRII